jgi:hypothetical protein
MKKIIIKSFVCFVAIFSLVSCVKLKEAGKNVGHATKDVTTKIGHASRDTVKAIGKETKETVNDIKKSSDK